MREGTGRRVAVATIALASLIGPAQAHAGRASADGHLVYVSSSGTSDAAITGGPSVFTITDNGEAVSAGPNCQSVSVNVATCTPTNTSDGTVRINGRVDLSGAQMPFLVRGGPGDDTIRGSDYVPPAGTPFAGEGDDIDGGAGTDTIDAGGGDDIVTAGGPNPNGAGSGGERDVLDGGPGDDKATYFDMGAPVTVDLTRPAGQGVAGENDTLAGFETIDARGSSGNTLIGSDGPETFISGDGLDHISGGGGDDVIRGGLGRDVIDGGTGFDRIIALGAASIDGGPGADKIVNDQKGQGPAKVFGGDGEDNIKTKDGKGGDTVSCGVGVDAASADPGDRPVGDCERINGAAQKPVAGKVVGAEPVRGKVLTKLPGSNTFTPLRDDQEIPNGAVLDTTHGTVQLTTAADLRKHGRQFTGRFSQGVFRVHQNRSKHPRTDIVMTGALSCGKARAHAARKSRRLFSSVRGRFRTRSRNSDASVRGTQWLVKDSCNSTLTIVKRGTVVVHDFGKRRNVTVKAGHSYLARRGNRRTGVIPRAGGHDAGVAGRLLVTLVCALAAAVALPAGASAGRWVAGDLHVHTTYSHDSYGGPSDDNTGPDEAYTLGHTVTDDFAIARSRGLDFLAISDHNDVRSQSDPGFGAFGVLGLPAYENSLNGHAQMLGATHLFDASDKSTAAVTAMEDALHAEGGLLQANHPNDPRWAYGYDVPVDTVEVWNLPWYYQPPAPSSSNNTWALHYWEGWLDRGAHVAATGGSDSHWVSTTAAQGPGQPTTWVYVNELSVRGVLDGIKAGHTFVSAEPPAYGGARVLLEADRNHNGRYESIAGDTVKRKARMRVRVRNATGDYVRIVTDGGRQAFPPRLVTGPRFVAHFRLGKGKLHWVRAEVYGEDAPDARRAACTAIFGHEGQFEETYCSNKVAMQALSSALYLR